MSSNTYIDDAVKVAIICFFTLFILGFFLCFKISSLRSELKNLKQIHTATIEACGEAWLNTK